MYFYTQNIVNVSISNAIYLQWKLFNINPDQSINEYIVMNTWEVDFNDGITFTWKNFSAVSVSISSNSVCSGFKAKMNKMSLVYMDLNATSTLKSTLHND